MRIQLSLVSSIALILPLIAFACSGPESRSNDDDDEGSGGSGSATSSSSGDPDAGPLPDGSSPDAEPEAPACVVEATYLWVIEQTSFKNDGTRNTFELRGLLEPYSLEMVSVETDACADGSPVSLAIARSGLAYVGCNDGSIELINPMEGSMQDTFIGPSANGTPLSIAFALAADGKSEILVAADQFTQKLFTISTADAKKTELPVVSGDLAGYALGLSGDAAGSLFVAARSEGSDLLVGSLDLATGNTKMVKSFSFFYVDGSAATPFVWEGNHWFAEPTTASQGGGKETNLWAESNSWNPAYTIGGQHTVAAAVSVCRLLAP